MNVYSGLRFHTLTGSDAGDEPPSPLEGNLKTLDEAQPPGGGGGGGVVSPRRVAVLGVFRSVP